MTLTNKISIKQREFSVSFMVILFLLTIFLTFLSYYFFDRPIASYVEHSGFNKKSIFHACTYIPNFILYFVTIILITLMIKKKTIENINLHQKILLSLLVGASSSVAIASFLKILLGRTGPTYWLAHINETGSYGFNLLKGFTHSFQDFPSGHTAAIFAITTIMYVSRKYYLVSTFALISTVIGLIFTNSHFLSDCIAGALLGFIIGLLSSRYFELRSTSTPVLH